MTIFPNVTVNVAQYITDYFLSTCIQDAFSTLTWLPAWISGINRVDVGPEIFHQGHVSFYIASNNPKAARFSSFSYCLPKVNVLNLGEKKGSANYDLASLALFQWEKRMHERNNELEGPSKLVLNGIFYQKERQDMRSRTWRELNPQWDMLQLLSRVQRQRHTHRATGPIA